MGIACCYFDGGCSLFSVVLKMFSSYGKIKPIRRLLLNSRKNALFRLFLFFSLFSHTPQTDVQRGTHCNGVLFLPGSGFIYRWGSCFEFWFPRGVVRHGNCWFLPQSAPARAGCSAPACVAILACWWLHPMLQIQQNASEQHPMLRVHQSASYGDQAEVPSPAQLEAVLHRQIWLYPWDNVASSIKCRFEAVKKKIQDAILKRQRTQLN